MNIIDTHCHLYLEEYRNDIEEVIARAQEYGVSRFYLPAINSEATADMLFLEAKYPGVCIPMMGLHPCYVKEDYKAELASVQDWLSKRKFVAIGEIGLDLYWDKTFYAQQQETFNTQMEWALEQQLPIVIHTRNAMRETLEMVKPFADKGLRGIFHCFSGNADDAKQVVDMGFLLGIGGVVTYKNGGLPEALAGMGLEHLVLETDSPYLSPVPFRGKRNESAYLRYIVERLAEIKHVHPDEVAAQTTANAQKIFGA